MAIETQKELFTYFGSIGVKTWSDFDSRYAELENLCRENGFRVGSTMDSFEQFIKSMNDKPTIIQPIGKNEKLNFKKEINAVVTMYCSISNDVIEISRATRSNIEKVLTGVVFPNGELLINWAVIHYSKGQTIEFDGLTLIVAETFKSDNEAIGRGITLSHKEKEKGSVWE